MAGVKQEHYAFHMCLCPKCRSEHRRWMFWTGRGQPRKYCNNCNVYRENGIDAQFLTPNDVHY